MEDINEGFVQIGFPSNGLVYSGINLDGLMIRPLKGRDEKMIAEMTPDNFEKKFISVLKNVIRGIDPLEMTLGDRLFALVWLAINTYSPLHQLSFVCDSCYQKITIDINLSQLQVIELSNDFKEPYLITLSDGRVVPTRLLRVKDELKAVEYEKNNSSWLYRLALGLTDFKTTQEALNFLENLPAGDVALIRCFHDKFYHGPDMNVDYICPKCSGGGRTSVPFRIEYILPSGSVLSRNYAKKV